MASISFENLRWWRLLADMGAVGHDSTSSANLVSKPGTSQLTDSMSSPAEVSRSSSDSGIPLMLLANSLVTARGSESNQKQQINQDLLITKHQS